MRKYKLIKKYPGSPKLGDIAYNDDTRWYVVDIKSHCNIPKYTRVLYGQDVENNPEFWKEVIEKDYEILSLVSSDKNPQHKKGSKFLHNKDYKFKNMTPTDFWDIYSVKRLSDGEIFTIGDKYKWKRNSKYNKIKTICLILLEDEEILIHDSNNITDEYDSHLNSIIKIKQPLFTTENGADIFEGDEFYAVLQDYTLSADSPIVHNEDREIRRNKINKTFSTKKIAEEYILMNKPCLSIKEIAPIFGQMHLDNSKTVLDRMTEKLVNLVKSKL